MNKQKVEEIEHGIPLPKKVGYGRVVSIARQMQVGDSVVIHWKDISALRVAINRMGFRMVLQPLEEDMARCWMTEKKRKE